MIRFLLDTNTVSELMRERPHARLEARLARRASACALPAPVIDELLYGVSRLPVGERRNMYQAWLEALMVDLPVIPLDGMCAQWHGRERARLAGVGKPPALFDGLIAAIAVVNELTLVTHNTADFTGFAGIRLQDWLVD